MEDNLLKTCLYDKHVALGALMSPFGGFIMPIQYTNITDEHNAVRQRAGMFDVSHMGEIFVSGPDADKFVGQIVSALPSLSRNRPLMTEPVVIRLVASGSTS